MSLDAVIGFSSPKAFNPVSWLIRKLTKSQCSHAFVIYHDPLLDREMVMEAHETGFRTLTYDNFKAKNHVVQVCVVDVDVTPGLRLLSTHLGSVYDYGGLFGMSFVLIADKLKRWIKRVHNPWASAKRLFCSEAVVIMLQASGSKLVEDVVPENISPQMLMELLNERG